MGVAQSNALALGTTLNTPAGQGRVVESCSIDITATATVGNRTYVASVISQDGTFLWRGALTAAVTAGQICGYDIGFGNVGAPSTVVRTRLGALTAVNVMVRENCPISTFENGTPQAPTNIIVQDAAGIDAADSMLFRIVYRQYPGVV